MRSRIVLAVAGCSVLLLIGDVLAAQTADDLAAKVRSCGETILASASARESIDQSMAGLVEVLSQIVAKETKLSAGSQEKVSLALPLVRKDPLGSRTYRAMAEVYQSIQGKKFVFPSDVDSIASATARARAKIDNSVKALQQGNLAEAAREIVDFVMIVITPRDQARRSWGPFRLVLPLQV